MYSEHGIDWYSISKFDNERIDLKDFSDIVGRAQPSHDIDRVTLHYRKKLLILFQNANQIVKQRTPELMMTNSDLQVKKSITSDNLHTLEG